MAKSSSRSQAANEAYAESSRAASRLSLLGAMGFGVALLMAALLTNADAWFTTGYGLELMLLAGGLGGGIVFTFLAVRASSMARAAKSQLHAGRRVR